MEEKSFTGYRDGSRPNMGRKLPAGATLQREEIMLGAVLRIADSIEAMSSNYIALQQENNRLNSLVQIKSKEIAALKSKLKGAAISHGKLKAKLK